MDRYLINVASRIDGHASVEGSEAGSGECCFFFSSRRRHTRLQGDWSSDVCSSDLDVLVVSAERQPVAVALNESRAAKGLRPLGIRTVPMVLAQDGLPIASRRIREGLDRKSVV